MNDTDIREVLHERAISVAPPTEVPTTLKRRMRRRQGANLLGVAALVALIAVGGIGAWRTLSPLGREGTKPAGGSATTSSIDIAYLPLAAIEVPHGWWLTDTSRAPGSQQILQLTNYEPDLSNATSGGCSPNGSDMPVGGARLAIMSGDSLASWPNGFPQGPPVLQDASGSEDADPSCETEQRVSWSGPDGTHYYAAVSIAKGGPSTAILQTALDSLRYPGQYPAPPKQLSATRVPQVWVGQGTDPKPWTMTAFDAGSNGDAYLEMTLDSSGTAGPGRVGREVPGFGAVGEADGGTLYGTVAAETTEIAVEFPDGSSIQGQLFPVPSSLWGPAQAFVVPAGDAVHSGDLVARDATGTVIGDVPLSNGGATGDSRYGPWSLTASLKNAVSSPSTAVPLQLHIDRGSFDIGQPLSDPGETLIDPQALMLWNITGDAGDGRYETGELVFGSVGSEVSRVEFRSDDDGSITPGQVFRLPGAEGGWRAFGFVTDASSGVVTAYDTSGEELHQYALEPFVNADDPADLQQVLAEGERAGTTWRLTIGEPPLEFSTDVFSDSFSMTGQGSGAPLPGLVTSQTIHESGLTLVYGSLPAGAASVRVDGDGTETTATIVRCPCGNLDGDFDFFYAELPPSGAIYHVSALAADGTVIEPPPLPTPSPPDRVAVPSPKP